MRSSIGLPEHGGAGANARTSRRRVWAILTVALVVSAGLIAGVYFLQIPGPRQQPSGLDFSGALAKSNQTVSNSSGGPWSLVSVLAVVTTQPVWPFPFDGEACQQYPGVSVWNSSQIPVWTGSLSSGISPFWSLWYLNASNFLIAAFTVNESVHLVGPIPPTSLCGEGLAATLANIGQGGGTVVWTSVDSTSASQVAWEAAGRSFVDSHPSVTIDYELDGAQQLVGVSEAQWGWAITYSVCGLPGFGGSTLWPGVRVDVNSSTGPAEYVINEQDQCSLASYQLSFSNAVTNPYPGGSALVTSPFNVTTANLTNETFDGLVSWMVELNLKNHSTGSSEPLATLSCAGSTFNETSCRVDSGSWYAVIAEPDGSWLDVFSAQGGNPGWALPTVPLYSGDSIILYLANSISATSLSLSVNSATPAVQVVGTASV
jgi:hypothetical protein